MHSGFVDLACVNVTGGEGLVRIVVAAAMSPACVNDLHPRGTRKVSGKGG